MAFDRLKAKAPISVGSSSLSLSSKQTQKSSTAPSGKPNSAESTDTDDIDENDEQGQSILLSLIAQLKPGSDLSRITLPTFILEKKSMLERITNQLAFHNLVLDAHAEIDPLQRFVKVVKWYLAGWHIAPKAVKKPLNPVLGEHFTCYWDLPNKQQAFYISEQTSHHPPESSYFYMIPESHIRVDGVAIPKSKFLGNSSAAMMAGATVLTFEDILDPKRKPEKYVLTQPNMYVRGILFGKMRIELGDHMIIKAPQFQADIEFKTKGFISGTYDAIEGVIKDYNNSEYYKITGKWNDVMYIQDLKNKTAKKEVLFDCSENTPSKPSVRPLEEQGEYESRRLWKKVTDALAKRDHTVATEEKFKIEDYQRTLAKKREESGVDFQPKLFRRAKPGQDLDYYIYKNIPVNADPELQILKILETAPILPGQQFTDSFQMAAIEKHDVEKREDSVTPRL